jgi:hypothetical protein
VLWSWPWSMMILSNCLNMLAWRGSQPSTISPMMEVSQDGHPAITCSSDKPCGMLEICCTSWPVFPSWCVGTSFVLWFAMSGQRFGVPDTTTCKKMHNYGRVKGALRDTIGLS